VNWGGVECLIAFQARGAGGLQGGWGYEKGRRKDVDTAKEAEAAKADAEAAQASAEVASILTNQRAEAEQTL
tara:strand:- start:604 stop:819 length:216 start_codon:yes stop_codon:yes gene_type:complete